MRSRQVDGTLMEVFDNMVLEKEKSLDFIVNGKCLRLQLLWQKLTSAAV